MACDAEAIHFVLRVPYRHLRGPRQFEKLYCTVFVATNVTLSQDDSVSRNDPLSLCWKGIRSAGQVQLGMLCWGQHLRSAHPQAVPLHHDLPEGLGGLFVEHSAALPHQRQPLPPLCRVGPQLLAQHALPRQSRRTHAVVASRNKQK